ncbi:MAG TPA: sulfotransferase [Pirellulales bacterium]|nr:sulfotransferase [Pirellulales bacterium]
MKKEITQIASIATGIETITNRWPEIVSPSIEQPIFVLAASWRSGSTLLQRMLMPEAFIWGEPYGHSGLIDSLADPFRAFTEAWPPQFYFHGGQPGEALKEEFIANLYPQPQSMLEAHLSFFDRLFIQPARAAGAKRWGLKEVRLTADHATYLKWMFPKSKFLFLHRNPWDAYRSYAAWASNGAQWYAKWPDEPLTLGTFGRHWRERAASFRDAHHQVGGLLVSYDELVGGRLGRIEDYLGFCLDQKALKNKPSDGGPPPAQSIGDRELAEFTGEVEAVAATLGYQPPLGIGAVRVTDSRVPPNKCGILVPTLGPIEPQCDEALNKLANRGYRVFRMRGHSQIDLGRSQLATEVLAQGCEETLWIDSDVVFEPDDVERLRSHGESVVSAVYPKKGPRALACHVLPGTQEIVFGEGGGLIEILYAATGFLLVKRKVYYDMQHMLGLPSCNQRFGNPVVPYFLPLVKPDGVGQWYLSEDYSFCERARQCGYRIWADTTIRLGHIGKYTYYWEDAGGDFPHYDTYHFHLKGAE